MGTAVRWPRWLDPAPHWLWWIPVSGMLLLVTAAFVTPWLAYRDEEANGATSAERESLCELVDWVKIRPLWCQVAEARPAADSSRVEGEVVGRTLFGVEVVRLWRENGVTPVRSETDYRSALLALAGFASGMMVLGSLGLIAMWKSE